MNTFATFVTMNKILVLIRLVFLLLISSPEVSTQPLVRIDTIPVKVNNNFLKHPWVGGHNCVQLSEIDINFDGIQDLFVFDRTGHKVSVYVNGGILNTIDYYDSTHKYAKKFPHLEDWAILRDFNCDGKMDIFTYAITVGGIKVWKNTSTAGNLQFTLQTPYLKSNYGSSVSNLYCSRVDLPAIDDVDGDGDLDVLTFDFSGTYLEFHINKSKELGYNCDSLIFQLDPNGCWGNFKENPSNCNIILASTCRMMNPDSLRKQNGKELHAGSCTLCFDLNNDGDKEVLIGDISCCNMTLLTNGGTPTSANMIAKDTAFPSYNIPINFNIFPCGFYLDLNNDGKRDLIVAPNAPNVSVDREGLWYYENTGTAAVPVFSLKKRNFLQENMIDAGTQSSPVFFDFTNDGLIDLLVSNYSSVNDTSCNLWNTYGVLGFKNIGTSNAPKFELVTSDYANLSTQLPNVTAKHLTFGDLDNDGDKDMFVGEYNGYIHYFENTGGSGPAVFTTPPVLNYPDNSGNPIDVGLYSTPQLIDMDNDNDLDLVIGERNGNLNYYPNIGTPSSPLFDLASFNPNFGGVDVMKTCCTGYSVPFIYDSSGSLRMFVGSEANKSYPPSGWIWYYTNISNNLNGNFTLIDSMYLGIWEGERMTIHGADINNDGNMDIAIGNHAGGVAIYVGNNPVGMNDLFVKSNIIIYPNPSLNGKFNIQSSISIYKAELIDLAGRILKTIPFENGTLELNEEPGIYFCRFIGNGISVTKKLVIIK